MNTKLYLKAVTFSIGLVLTLGVAGLHGKVESNTDIDNPENTSDFASVPRIVEKQVSLKEKIEKPDQINVAAVADPEESPQKPAQSGIKTKDETPIIVSSIESASIEKSIGLQARPKPSIAVQEVVLKRIPEDTATAEKDKTLNEPLTVPGTSGASEKKAQTPEVKLARSEIKKREAVPDNQDINTTENTENRNYTSGDYVLMGNRYFEKGETEKAVFAFSKAIDLNKNNAEAYNNRGYAFYSGRKNKKAIDDFSMAVKISPDYIYAFYNRANTYSTMGKYKKAISDYNRVIKLAPDFSLAYVSRGNIYFDMNKSKKAGKDYTKALELNDKNADAYLMRGNVYQLDDKYEEAINDYSKAIEINPDHADAYRFRSLAYASINQHVKARQDISDAYKISPDIINFDAQLNPVYKKIFYHALARSGSRSIVTWFLTSDKSKRFYEYREMYPYMTREEFRDFMKVVDDVLEIPEPDRGYVFK